MVDGGVSKNRPYSSVKPLIHKKVVIWAADTWFFFIFSKREANVIYI